MTAPRTGTPEVVVTGLGATTPLGGDAASTWAAALAGESGARTLDNDWAQKYGLPVTFAATIKVKPEEVLARPEIKRMDPSAQYAIIATREAWADAGSPRSTANAWAPWSPPASAASGRRSTAGTPCVSAARAACSR